MSSAADTRTSIGNSGGNESVRSSGRGRAGRPPGSPRPGCRTPSRRSGRDAGCRRCDRCGRSGRARTRPTRRAWRAAAPATETAGRSGTPRRTRRSRRRTCRARRRASTAGGPVRWCGGCASPGSGGYRASSRTRRARRSSRTLSKSSSTSSSTSIVSRAWRSNAGTHWIVTLVTMPSAPTPTRATRSRSGRVVASSHVTTLPLPSTSSIPTIVVARLPRPAPVPWVAVLIAPAIDWELMSPRFGIASPTAASSSQRSRRRIPAWTVTRPAAASTCSTAFIASSESSTPFVIAAAVNECPAPMALTRRPDRLASATIDATSSVLAGFRTSTGTQVWFLAQLRTVAFAGIILEITSATVVPTAVASADATAVVGWSTVVRRTVYWSTHHPPSGLLDRGVADPRVQPVGVGGAEELQRDAAHGRVLDDQSDHRRAEATAAVFVEHVDVGTARRTSPGRSPCARTRPVAPRPTAPSAPASR